MGVHRKSYRKEKKPDYTLLILIIFLLTFGWIMVYSSSAIIAFSQNHSSFFYFYRQFIWILFGSILGYILYKIDYKKLKLTSTPLLISSIILLILVLIAGVQLNGAKRWIRLPFFDLQPSELAKFSFILYLASWLSTPKKIIYKNNKIKNYLYTQLLPFLFSLSIILILILIEPDLGTTMIIGTISLIMFYMSDSGTLHNLGFMLLIVSFLFIGSLAAILERYRLKRIQTFIKVIKTGQPPDPLGSGYQLSQVLVAIGSGGIFGVGFGQGRQKFNYLGETAFSDTIFAVIAEEFGLLGASIVISVFLIILLRGIKIAQNAPDKFAGLLALGITTLIVLQAFLNISANIGLIPLTGIPLPYISYGGSSMIITLALTGLLLNISKYAKLN